MSSQDVIVLDDVYLSYKTIPSGERTLKGYLIGLAKGKHSKNSKKSAQLRDVSLRIRHGEQVGIIGRNGSGKSTLLKLIAGILRPDSGEVRVDGSITPLIDIGTGMNPELSCRENIYLSAAYLGLSRGQISDKIDEILDWAELELVADNPIHTLSTGMQTRLAFAVSTSQKPDIVLIDEMMSVGDIYFREKSKQRMQALLDLGSSVLIVSHDLNYLSKSVSRVIWLENGSVRLVGEPNEVISAYQDSF